MRDFQPSMTKRCSISLFLYYSN